MAALTERFGKASPRVLGFTLRLFAAVGVPVLPGALIFRAIMLYRVEAG